MQIWSSDVVCKQPIANGFSCGAVNKIIFKYAGDVKETLTWTKVQDMVNLFTRKVCQKCHAKKWQVTSLTPVSYIPNDTMTRH